MIPADQMQNDQYAHLKKVIEEKKKIRNPLIEILRLPGNIWLPEGGSSGIYCSRIKYSCESDLWCSYFLQFFYDDPRGKYNLNVCLGTACFVKGARLQSKCFQKNWELKMGETTKDGLFTMSSVRCVGACSLAPVFVIGEETYGRIDSKDKIAEILKRYK